jgi:hypothetical protein
LAADCRQREKEAAIQHKCSCTPGSRRTMHSWCPCTGAKERFLQGTVCVQFSGLSQKKAQASDSAGRAAAAAIAQRLISKVSTRLIEAPAGSQPDQLGADQIRCLFPAISEARA